MKLVLSILLTFFPAFIENKLRKILLNQHIGKGSKIGFFAVVSVKNLTIGKRSKIRPFSFISAESLEIGNDCVIKSFTIISTRIIKIANYVHIANFAFIRSPHNESSKLSIGNHSRIFPFCWLDTNQGITLGNHVGIGGFSLIFTHGVWSNYFKGGPVTFEEVIIEDDVWIPWRVFVMPGVTIGKGSIIGANSLVNKNIPKNSLAAGSPTKILKEGFLKEPSSEEIINKLDEAVVNFFKYLLFKKKIEGFKTLKDKYHYSSNQLEVFINGTLKDQSNSLRLNILTDEVYSRDKHGSFVWEMRSDTLYFDSKQKLVEEFSDYIRRYGVRLNKIDNGSLY